MPLAPMLSNTWTLPIDTVMAIWHSAYPFFLARMTGDENGGDDIQKPPRIYLDSPEKMADWLRRKFTGVHAEDRTEDGSEADTPKIEPVAPEFVPPGGMKVTVWRGLSRTYVVHRHGLTLPHPDTAAPGADDLPQAEFDNVLAQHLRDWGIATPEADLWSLRGTQIDLLRACVSLATVRFWRAGTPSPEPEAFRTALLALCEEEAGEALPAAALRVVPRADLEDGEVGGVRYRNAEDGAGLFAPDGYTMAVPPAPAPDQPGWGKEHRKDDDRTKAMLVACAFVYARYDYATPCCCAAPVAGAGHEARPAGYPGT